MVILVIVDLITTVIKNVSSISRINTLIDKTVKVFICEKNQCKYVFEGICCYKSVIYGYLLLVLRKKKGSHDAPKKDLYTRIGLFLGG